jgi:FMN-dependent NADH-azoreductase
MPTLLQLDSSPLESSISRELTREFVRTWRIARPVGKVIYRDLAANPPRPVDALWIFSTFTPEISRTSEQNESLAPSDEFIAELEEADEYVIGVAMHNFSIPAVLKLWIDQIVRNGRTFTYKEGGRQGLLRGKKATVLSASGGIYEAGTAAGALNFIDPYLKTVFSYLGVTDVKFVSAGGVAQVMAGVIDRAVFLESKFEVVRVAAGA